MPMGCTINKNIFNQPVETSFYMHLLLLFLFQNLICITQVRERLFEQISNILLLILLIIGNYSDSNRFYAKIIRNALTFCILNWNSTIVQSDFSYFMIGILFQSQQKQYRLIYILTLILSFGLFNYNQLFSMLWKLCNYLFVSIILLLYEVMTLIQQYQKNKQPVSVQIITTRNKTSTLTNEKEIAEQFRKKVSQQSQSINKMSIDSKHMPFKDSQIFKELFSQLPDGIIILNQERKMQYCNLNFQMLMKANKMEDAIEKLLKMRNSYQDFKEQAKYEKLFTLLNCKMKSKQYSSIEEGKENEQPEFMKLRSSVAQKFDCFTGNFEESGINLSTFEFLSNTLTVEEEFDQLIQNLKDRFNQDTLNNLNLLQPNTSIEKSTKFYQEIFMMCHYQNHDCQQSWFQVVFKPFLYKLQPFIMFTIRDVTHINTLAGMEQINYNKSQMLQNVSHEFRTPLSCIILLVDSLIDLIQDDDIKNKFSYLFPIKSTSNQLLALANDLLDVAQLKAGKFSLALQYFNLKEFLAEIINLLKVQAQFKGLYLNMIFNYPNGMIHTDPNRLRQIIINLVANSIKFTIKGGITIIVDQMAQDVKITVQDTGIGIRPEDQDKLFQAFGRLPDPSNLNNQGIGLGLMISNILAQKLSSDGSGLAVFSEGDGSVFSFQIRNQAIPAIQVNQAKLDHSDDDELMGDSQSWKMSAEDQERRQTSQKQFYQDYLPQFNSINHSSEASLISHRQSTKILAIDDTAFNLLSLEILLKKDGIEIDKAFSGAEAIKKCQKINYSVILVDLEMPIMDGFECCRELLKINKSFFLIGCSAHNKEDYFKKCIEVGMKDYLEKPIKIDELRKILQLVK